MAVRAVLHSRHVNTPCLRHSTGCLVACPYKTLMFDCQSFSVTNNNEFPLTQRVTFRAEARFKRCSLCYISLASFQSIPGVQHVQRSTDITSGVLVIFFIYGNADGENVSASLLRGSRGGAPSGVMGEAPLKLKAFEF